MATQGTKPYLKLASTLVVVGVGLFSLEQYGLGKWAGPAHHIDGTLLSILILVPVVMVIAGALVFVVGRMRRL